MKMKMTASWAAMMVSAMALASCSSTPEAETEPSPAAEEGEPRLSTVVVTGTKVGDSDSVADPSPSPPPPPPPPPPAPAMSRKMSSAPVEARRAEGGVSADAAISTSEVSPPPPPDRPEPPAQSGLLTAGDYDDLLNAKLYRDYASEFLLNNRGNIAFPDIDVTDAVTIKVVGRNGRPLRGATVALRTGNQAMFQLTTSSAGTVRLFPDFDALPEDLTISITGRGAMVRQLDYRDIAQRNTSDPVMVSLNEPEQTPTEFDLMLVIDTTGSMGDELRYLQAELKDIIASIESTYPTLNTRIGLTLYRDVGDEYVVRDFDFTSNIEELQANLAAQKANGGGNYPEAMDQALETAMGQSWRPGSIKAMMLVADAPPRDANIGKAWDQAILARPKGIHIVPVAASGVGPKAEYIMRAMAAVTQSRYIFLTDDSGVGNPHAEPDVDCYIVTRLDTMVKRVLSSLISGNRVEPSDAEIIRSVGEYNRGVCELPTIDTEQVEQVKGGN